MPRAAGNQDLVDFVAAIDARIAGLTTGWEADAMAPTVATEISISVAELSAPTAFSPTEFFYVS